eukprot:SAG11_NODE_4036_length_2095_cov_1.346693_3_plen_57_part_00
MLDVAKHFEGRALQQAGGRAENLASASEGAKAFLRNAILLYHKGGQVATPATAAAQ